MIDLSVGDAMTMRGGNAAALGRIDQYELVRELGGGGFGCVYLARDTVAGIEVAVKGLPPEVKHNKEELENIRANFALVSRLHHPNIAAALVLHPTVKAEYASRDVMEKLRVFERDTMMVMEYAPGVTLSQWRKQFPEKKVPFEKALAITRQVAAALDYAHGEKIVHRDVKPSNVVVETREDGSVVARVLDFGLAAEIRSSMGRVSREIRDTSGTRPYMAPEQWRGAKQGPATDQYALAAMFCELVTGEVPFASVFDTGDPVLMKTAVATDAPEFPKEMPKSVRFALSKALSKKPEERFATCTAFADALGRARTPAAPLKWITISVILFAMVAVGGWWWRGRVKSEELRVRNEALAAERARQAEEIRQAEEVKRAEEARGVAEKAEAERKKKAEAERVAEEKAEAERRAKDEADRKAKVEAERIAAEKAETELKAKLEAERIAEEKRKAEEARIAEEKRRAEKAERNRKEEKERAIREGRNLKIGQATCKMVYCEGKDGVPSFWISQKEISRGMWDGVMQTSILPKRGEGAAVVNVSWDDCRAFVERVNGRSESRVRLPAVVEVESALRRGILTAKGCAWTADDFDIGASAGIKCAVDLGHGRRMGLLGSSRRGDLGLYLVAED